MRNWQRRAARYPFAAADNPLVVDQEGLHGVPDLDY